MSEMCLESSSAPQITPFWMLQYGFFSNFTLIGIIMKKLAILTLLAASGAVFASGGHSSGSSSGPVINADSLQVAMIKNSAVKNTASGSESDAKQNISSNAGKVRVDDEQEQITVIKNSSVTNEAKGSKSFAGQNLSSNVGDVRINDDSTQVTYVKNSLVANLAKGYKSKAVQNIASNNGCDTCN